MNKCTNNPKTRLALTWFKERVADVYIVEERFGESNRVLKELREDAPTSKMSCSAPHSIYSGRMCSKYQSRGGVNLRASRGAWGLTLAQEIDLILLFDKLLFLSVNYVILNECFVWQLRVLFLRVISSWHHTFTLQRNK